MTEFLLIHKYCGIFAFVVFILGVVVGKVMCVEDGVVGGYDYVPRGDIYKQMLKKEGKL